MGGLFSSGQSTQAKPYGGAKDLLKTLSPQIPSIISGYQQSQQGLPGAIESSATPLGQNLSNMLETPLDSNAVLQPIEESYNRTILPGIKSSAVSAGAPGGSREGDLMTQAAGQFGRDEASALANAQTARIAATGVASPVANALQTAGAQQTAQTGAQTAMAPLQIILQALTGFNPYAGSATTGTPSILSDIQGGTNAAGGMAGLAMLLGML